MPAHAATRGRGDGHDRRSLSQAFRDARSCVLDGELADVPLVESDERRVLGLARDVGHRQVVIDDPFARVDEDDGHVGPLRGLQRAQLRVVLDALPRASLPAEARGVDEDRGGGAALAHGVD